MHKVGSNRVHHPWELSCALLDEVYALKRKADAVSKKFICLPLSIDVHQ